MPEEHIHSPSAESKPPDFPSFAQALRYWFILGCTSFGGPAGQIAMMHRELVEKRRWISNKRFMGALDFCMLLPGPEAQQLATYLGWRMHGVAGGIAAGALFVLPSVVILLGLSWLYMAGGQLPWLAAIFHGLNAAVIAIIAHAVIRIGSKSLKSPSLFALAASAFIAIYFFHVSFILIVALAALTGWLGYQRFPRQFPAAKDHSSDAGDTSSDFLTLPPSPPPSLKSSLIVVASFGTLWLAPLLALVLWLGTASTPVQMGLFFSKASLVTFGGAYAVLPYVAQQAVEHHQWLSHEQMMAGLALAETTPGPLIMVLQFVGFAGGWQNPGTFSPLFAATLCAFITTWCTFLPSFLMVFLGAPHVESLQKRPSIGAALSGITAAVVGVILNLAITFAIPALGLDASNTPDYFIALLALATFIALKSQKVSMLAAIAFCGFAGLLHYFIP